MTETATLTRTRVRLEQREAAAIATALVTGSPVPVPYGWSRQASSLARIINDRWSHLLFESFPALAPEDNSADVLHNLAVFISGTGPFYGECFTIAYGGTTHAHACVWDDDPARDTFGFSSTVEPHAVYATTRGGGFNTTSWLRNYRASPGVLDGFVFDIDAAARPGMPAADATLFLRTCDVVTESGVAHDDPAWYSEIPAPSQDLIFESIFPRGVCGRYELTRRLHTD